MRALALALALLAAAPSLAHDYKAGDLTIDHPVAIEPPPMAMAAAGYFTLRNSGTEPDRLLAIEAPPFRAELHESFEEGGMHKMRAIEALEIPAGGEVVLQSGSYHVMFLGEALKSAALKEGGEVPAALIFEKAGRVEVVFNVEKRGAAHSKDAGGHHHGH